MLYLAEILLTGMLISFLGQLPLGNMNLTATQLNVQEGHRNAWLFGLGIAIVEVIYLRLALTGMNWIIQNKVVFTILGWLTIIVFLTLGVLSFMSANKQSPQKKGLLINNRVNRLLLGMGISVINPVQIPFWFTWSIYLVHEKVLHPVNSEYNALTIGAGLGTLAGLAVYIYGGKWAIGKMNANNRSINKFMGVAFIAVALIQLYKLIFNPWTKATL